MFSHTTAGLRRESAGADDRHGSLQWSALSRFAIYISIIVLTVLFEMNFLSPGGNVVVGLVVTGVVLILMALFGND